MWLSGSRLSVALDEVDVLRGHLPPQRLGVNLLPSSLRSWQDVVPRSCRTEVPVSTSPRNCQRGEVLRATGCLSPWRVALCSFSRAGQVLPVSLTTFAPQICGSSVPCLPLRAHVMTLVHLVIPLFYSQLISRSGSICRVPSYEQWAG